MRLGLRSGITFLPLGSQRKFRLRRSKTKRYDFKFVIPFWEVFKYDAIGHSQAGKILHVLEGDLASDE